MGARPTRARDVLLDVRLITSFTALASALVVAAAIGCGSPDGNTATDPSYTVEATVGYGWERPVTAQNFSPAAEKINGAAKQPLAGHTLQQVVTDPNVRVRADGNPCVACHTWAANADRDSFCKRVPDFLAEPTSKGDGTDPLQAKPQALKDLLSKWQAANCPL